MTVLVVDLVDFLLESIVESFLLLHVTIDGDGLDFLLESRESFDSVLDLNSDVFNVATFFAFDVVTAFNVFAHFNN